MYVNGYARFVQYQITTQDYHERYNPLTETKLNRLKPELLFVTEGQYQNGYLNGFGRRLYKNEQCQIGYWRDSMPYGKFQLYRYGHIKDGEEGIWRGWGPPPMAKPLESMEIDSFMENIEPPEEEIIEVEEDEDDDKIYNPFRDNKPNKKMDPPKDGDSGGY